MKSAEAVIRKYSPEDLPEMMEIWNEVVEEGNAFPQDFTRMLSIRRV